MFLSRLNAGSRPPGPTRRARIAVEALESRLAPATFLVTTAADAGPGSLRQAIAAAALNAQADLIRFAPALAGKTITLTTNHADTSVGATGLVINNDRVTIDGGAAPGLRISGGNARRVFAVTTTGNLSLVNLTVTGGLARGGDGGDGGDGYGGGGGGGAGLGGGVFNRGTLNIVRTLFVANVARGGHGGDAFDGFLEQDDSEGGGGGGGMGGHGGSAGFTDESDGDGGGGGGGTIGNGGDVFDGDGGGGGGGTRTDGADGDGDSGGAGGSLNGGAGGDDGSDGVDGGPGGGGGGGGNDDEESFTIGGDGGFGGGGGGSGDDGDGGDGGFGGGGGGSDDGFAGFGGFGGGGGGAGDFGDFGLGGFGGGDGGFGADFETEESGNGGGGGGGGLGGGVFNYLGRVTISNSTFSANRAVAGPGGQGAGVGTDGKNGRALGGALFNYNGSVGIVNATFARNVADAGGGVFNLAEGNDQIPSRVDPGRGVAKLTDGRSVVVMYNSIVADTVTGTDFETAAILGGTSVTLGAFNLVETNAAGNGFKGTFVAADPRLGALANNGGTSMTHALLAGSRAIDGGGNAFAAGPFDQRGTKFARVERGRVDIGAFEVQVPDVIVIVTPFANRRWDR